MLRIQEKGSVIYTGGTVMYTEKGGSVTYIEETEQSRIQSRPNRYVYRGD